MEKVNDETQIIKYTVCRWIQAGGRWQEGQRSLLQMTVDDKFFKKYFLSSELNSGLLRIIFMFSSEKSSQVLGKLIKGCLSEEESLEKGICKRSLFLRTWRCRSPLLSSLVDHVLMKDDGKKPCLKRCINCKLKKVIRSGKGRIDSFLNKGSECSLYFELLIRRIAFFCITVICLKLELAVLLQIGRQ